MNTSSSRPPTRPILPGPTPTLTLTLLAVAALAAHGCIGPLAERASDRGKQVGLARLRDVHSRGLEQLKADPTPPPAVPDPGAPAGAALQRPASRFAGAEKVALTL